MKNKRIIGMVLILVGVCLLGASSYIKGQVIDGKEKISSAQSKVDATNTLFSLSPATKDVGQGFTGGAQKKINQGKEEVQYYEALAGQLQVGGYIALALGVIVFALGFRRKS